MVGTADGRRAALMVAAQQGDRAAYDRLLRDCVPLIRGVARSMGVTGDRAEDVVQDVLLSIHRVRQTYDPARSFDTWLRAIARRRAIDVLRRDRRHQVQELYAPIGYENHPDPGRSPEQGAEHARQTQLLALAMRTLPAGQRQAIDLLALQERSLAEVADETGRTKVALKVNLHRAIRTLRRRMAPAG
jgi:RNA polymerase sigma-70 factor (ECF subfamily)